MAAALVVAPASGERWERTVDLRVEDHPEPLAELRRLLTLHDAYVLAGEGDQLSGEGRLAEAAARYVAAHERAPDSTELAFWAGLALVARGEAERGGDPGGGRGLRRGEGLGCLRAAHRAGLVEAAGPAGAQRGRGAGPRRPPARPPPRGRPGVRCRRGRLRARPGHHQGPGGRAR